MTHEQERVTRAVNSLAALGYNDHMRISIVIPAYNEEKYLGETLGSIVAALAEIKGGEIVVVDNESTDSTRAIAERSGATIVTEAVHNISSVRNAGAVTATGEVLVFVDADTQVQPGLFEQITACMLDNDCVGGAVAVKYGPAKRQWVKYYLMGWQFWGRFLKMRQGAAQFCRKTAFDQIGGYDESIYVGEDIEFHWRLDKLFRETKGRTHFIEDPPVLTSSRRFDKMGLVRTLVVTHPITIFLGWRIKRLWKDWYENAVR